MQFTFLLTVAAFFTALLPSVFGAGEAENGRGTRRYDDYYDNNDYGYGGYGRDHRRRGHGRRYYDNDNYGYYRYRRDENAVQEAQAADNTQAADNAQVADEADGRRHRHHHHHHRRHNRYYDDYDNDYYRRGYGRGYDRYYY